MIVIWYSWDSYLAKFFKPFKVISKFHHFCFSKAKPGSVMASNCAGGEKVEASLLRNGDLANLGEHVLPPVLEPAGLSNERKGCLRSQIKEYCRSPHLLDSIIQ